jgi:hypothetical protein
MKVTLLLEVRRGGLQHLAAHVLDAQGRKRGSDVLRAWHITGVACAQTRAGMEVAKQYPGETLEIAWHPDGVQP